MKSSTIRRSTLSKESMQVIENLAKEQEEQIVNNEQRQEIVDKDSNITEDTQKEPIRSKEKELDLLWQSFVPSQITSISPLKTGIIGFVIGVITTLLIVFCAYAYRHHQANYIEPSQVTQEESTIEDTATEEETTEKAKVDIPSEAESQAPATTVQEDKTNPSEKTPTIVEKSNTKMRKYVVKNGDTGENIIKHFYGSYSPELADKVIKANNLKSLDRINIDQELLIPEN